MGPTLESDTATTYREAGAASNNKQESKQQAGCDECRPRMRRDPFIERLPNGDGFSLVTTNGWWSRSIVYYRSRTLIDWSEGQARASC